jgi:RNA polymerase-binding transcription factor DksA
MLGDKCLWEVAIMNDATLLLSVEGLGDSPFVGTGGEIWELLQSEKGGVCRDLNAEGPLCSSEASGLREHESSETNGREIEWRHRGQFEARLRYINDAQDRLIDGAYGRCADCGEEIDAKRLVAYPAASLCIACQRNADGETRFRTM